MLLDSPDATRLHHRSNKEQRMRPQRTNLEPNDMNPITGRPIHLFEVNPAGNRRYRRLKEKMDRRFEVAAVRYVYEGRTTEAFWQLYADEAACFEDLTADEIDDVLSRGWLR